MFNMIKADMYRILKGKGIYIAIILVLLLCFVSAIGMSAGYVGINTATTQTEEEVSLYEELNKAKSIQEYRTIMKENGSFALDKEVIGQNANLYYIFIILVVVVLCTDFSNKSVKNTLSSAISRKKYYLSKNILIFGLCTFIILFNNYFFYFLNLFMNGSSFSSSLYEITKITITQLPLLYGIISLQICIAFLVKKTATFNTITIPFLAITQLLVIGFTNLFKVNADWFYNYELQFALAKLTSSPSISFVMTCTILGLIYIVVFHLIAYTSIKRAEIK